MCEHGFIGACAQCDGAGQIPDREAEAEDMRLEVINDSDAVCGGCGADPKQAPDAHKQTSGWFIDRVMVAPGTFEAQVLCPACW